MRQFIVVLTSELEDPDQDFIGGTHLCATIEQAQEVGRKWLEYCAGYPCLGNFYVYKLLENHAFLTDDLIEMIDNAE